MAGVHVKLIFGWVKNILNQYNLVNNYRFFTKKQSLYSSPMWNGLPDVAIRKIFGQLQTRDRARLMMVSKSWKQILCRDDLPTVPELWRFCLYSKLTKRHVKLVSTSDGLEYFFKLPKFRKDSCKAWLCGSSDGWLLVASGPKFNPDLFLWNPLTDVIMTLPRLSTLPFLSRAMKSGPDEYNISSYIKRVVVFSQESVVVAVVFSNSDDDEKQDTLALCTPKDRKWTVFGRHHFHTLSDILFHDGKLYVLAKHITKDKDKKSTNFKTKICLSKCQIQVCVLCFDYQGDEDLGDGSCCYKEDVVSNPMFNVTRGDKISEHLVELSGQLLFIAVVFDLVAYNSNGDVPIKTFRCHQMQRIEVRKVDGMAKVVSLGDDRIITLADTGSLAVPPSAVGEYDSGRIVFSTQYARGTVGDQDDDDDEIQCVVHEQGTFDLENNEFRVYCAQYFKHPGQLISGWHTPKLFSDTF